MHPVAPARFKMINEIARGGMGIVYCAMDTILNEMVVLKMLPKDFLEEPEALERFIREVKATRKLNHRNIVRIYDIVEDQNMKYISMEFINGKNLRQILRQEKKLSEMQVVEYMKQCCAALKVAHDEGVVHRDLKPANIMVDSTGTVKVMDFGIAKLMGAERLTSTTDLIGTPLYMSPEQCQGLAVDARSDLYSLGILMYELLTGEVPFRVGNIVYHHMHVKPSPPEGVSLMMQEIVMKCLEKDPNNRYSSALELYQALNQVFPSKQNILP